MGRKSADGTTPEHTQHQVQEGESGTEARYRYTNKKSERSPYIAERAKLAHNLTEREILQLQYQNRAGVTVPYQKSDLRYDTQQGYLQITSGGRAEGGRAPPERRTVTGTQPRREAKGRSKNRAAGRLTAESARTSGSSPGSSSRERQGDSTTQPQQRPRTRRQAHQATHTEAQRPAPDISKKMRPKNGDKEG